ncbi:MAG: hypothetical protein V5789_12080 [Colwellia sp.]
MKAKQAVKNFTLLSMVVVGMSACSSTPESEKQPTQVAVVAPIVEETIVEEQKKVSSTVMNNGVIDIPVLEDATIFAEFSDELPAVINYFTHASEAQVIDFYQQEFGEVHSQDRRRGRLTLKYQEGEETMRVVISPQNNKRQVDIIIESKY